jgi:hypothetical protein
MSDEERLETLIRHFKDQGATEAAVVSDVLQNLLDSQDSEMIEPNFVITVLEELIGWATTAKAMMAGTMAMPE